MLSFGYIHEDREPKSFGDLGKVGSQVHVTYGEAYFKRYFLENDG